MKPFARVVLEPAHGVMLTSATLTDATRAAPNGPARSPAPARRISRSRQRLRWRDSPFDYAAQAEVLIVTDITQGDHARAGRRLCAADRGLRRRRARPVHRDPPACARSMAGLPTASRAAGLPLYAQHVDPIDTGTLVDIFRDDPRASLLGTDALRDGVDVPGRIAALRGDGKRAMAAPDHPPPRAPRRCAGRRAAL